MWYIVEIDCEGSDDWVIAMDHEPTQAEIDQYSEYIGFACAGAYRADSGREAIDAAYAEITAGRFVPTPGA